MEIGNLTSGVATEGVALIKDAQLKTTRTGDPFLALRFADRTGEISGNLWDATENQVAQFKAGVVVELAGQVETYQDQLQFRIQELRLASPEEGQPEDFVPRVAETDGELKDDLRPFLAAIHQVEWATIVNHLFKKYGAPFFNFPAAKVNHHALVGGLAFHTLSILRLAKNVCDQYPGINRELLYAGALLHDMGKVIELSGPVATQYTTTGNLLGHISIVDGEIVACCQEVGLSPTNPQVVLLRHVILAHHGLREYGSPVEPELMEAEVLHRLDELDAAITEINGALEQTAPGEFSPRQFALDRRQFYRLPTGQDTKKA